MVLPGILGEIVLDRLYAADVLLPIISLTGNADPALGRYVLARERSTTSRSPST
jgi:hypothetical protein